MAILSKYAEIEIHGHRNSIEEGETRLSGSACGEGFWGEASQKLREDFER